MAKSSSAPSWSSLSRTTTDCWTAGKPLPFWVSLLICHIFIRRGVCLTYPVKFVFVYDYSESAGLYRRPAEDAARLKKLDGHVLILLVDVHSAFSLLISSFTNNIMAFSIHLTCMLRCKGSWRWHVRKSRCRRELNWSILHSCDQLPLSEYRFQGLAARITAAQRSLTYEGR